MVIDFAGAGGGTGDGAAKARRLVPLYDGHPGEENLFAAVLGGRPPVLGVADADTGRQIVTGTVAVDDMSVVSRAADQIFSRFQSLFLMAVDRLQHGRWPEATAGEAGPSAPRSMPSVAAFAASQVVQKIRARLSLLVSYPHHWRVAYRPTDGRGIWQTHALAGRAFTVVRDDGRRYYADPSAIMRHGRIHLFMEELPYATGRGIISCCEILADGTNTPVRPIIETGYHLSYPFIFEHEGEVWMIPETSDNRTIELWKPIEFPHSWGLHAILVRDIVAADATVCSANGRLWLFASTRHDDSSNHDALRIWHADRLEGPWHPLDANPVLVDARAARPAGAMRLIGEAMWRPAQDCSDVYGGALSLCRVDRLDPDHGFAQTLVSRVSADDLALATGLHTLNEAGGIEFIDLCGPSRTLFRKPSYTPAAQSTVPARNAP